MINIRLRKRNHQCANRKQTERESEREREKTILEFRINNISIEGRRMRGNFK